MQQQAQKYNNRIRMQQQTHGITTDTPCNNNKFLPVQLY